MGVISRVTAKVGHYTIKNAPTILTVFAAGGAIYTAVLTGKATLRARDILEEHEMDQELLSKREDGMSYYRERTFTEKFKLTWRCYIPAVLMCGSTIGCIIGANTVNLKRNAALLAAYSLSEEAAKEFRNKVVETIGEKKTKKIDHEIAEDRIKSLPAVDDVNITRTARGNDLFYEWSSGRYFRASREFIDREVNHMNKLIRHNEFSSVNDWYELLGLKFLPWADDLGWYYKGQEDQDDFLVEYDSTLTDDGVPCGVVKFKYRPEYKYI